MFVRSCSTNTKFIQSDDLFLPCVTKISRYYYADIQDIINTYPDINTQLYRDIINHISRYDETDKTESFLVKLKFV